MCDFNNCPCFPEIHTIKEWAELPDKISVLGKWYVFSDYRTDNEVNIPRFKFGDGKTYISKLPFCTASITDYDVEIWDEKAEVKEQSNKILTFFKRLFKRKTTKA